MGNDKTTRIKYTLEQKKFRNYITEAHTCPIYIVTKYDQVVYGCREVDVYKIIDGPKGSIGKYIKWHEPNKYRDGQIEFITLGKFGDGRDSAFENKLAALKYQKELTALALDYVQDLMFEIKMEIHKLTKI